MEHNENKLHIKTITWSKDASQLIDYSDPHLFTSSFDINSNCCIVRAGNEVASLKEDKVKPEFQLLSTIKCTQVDYFYQPIINPKDNLYDELAPGNSSWFVLRHNKLIETTQSTKYLISEGDILKLGRIWLRIKKIKHESQHMNTSYSYNDIHQSKLTEAKEGNNKPSPKKVAKIEDKDDKQNKEKVKSKKAESKKDKVKPICRICYGEEADDDPLIQPCICSGTMKYIHYSCIKTWITSRSSIKSSLNTDCVSYLLSKIECELCKTTLPDYVRHNGELYELLDFTQSFDNYIVFEKISLDNSGHKFLYFVNFNENNQINIGRGHEANLILEEISVSRIHCIISKVQKSFYIEDNNSKFGTLVLVQAPQLKVIQGLPLSVQIGRVNLQMTIKEPFRLFTCCGVTEYNNNNTYDRENLKYIDVNRFKMTKEEEDNSEEDEEKVPEKQMIQSDKGDLYGECFLKINAPNLDEIEANYKIEQSVKRKDTSVHQEEGGENKKDAENKKEGEQMEVNKDQEGDNHIRTIQEEENS